MEYWNIDHPLIGIPYSELSESKKESDRYYADKAIAAFEAYIDGCEKPDTDISTHTEYGHGYYHGWEAAIEADRKALMESLE